MFRGLTGKYVLLKGHHGVERPGPEDAVLRQRSIPKPCATSGDLPHMKEIEFALRLADRRGYGALYQ
jgi:hypothetical protein